MDGLPRARILQVVNVSTSKTGKHGHAKANFTATDIFTGKKLEDVIPSTHTTSVPVVRRNEYQLLDISDDGFCSLLTGEMVFTFLSPPPPFPSKGTRTHGVWCRSIITVFFFRPC